MAETPAYGPDVAREKLNRVEIVGETRASLKNLGESVDKMLERRKRYEACIQANGFDPASVHLEVTETSASMTIPSAGGDFKVWTADGYSWYLDDVTYKPSSYSPSAWFDSYGIDGLEAVLNEMHWIEAGFQRIKKMDQTGREWIDSPVVQSNPFDGSILAIRVPDVEEQAHFGKRYVYPDGRNLEGVYHNGYTHVLVAEDIPKLLTNLNARYKKLYGTKK